MTFLLCAIAALSSIWLLWTVLDHQRANKHKRSMNVAYFAAEAGVAQVIHWGNMPDDYDNGGTSALFYRDPSTDTFPNLTSALNSGNVTIASDKLGSFTSADNDAIATVRSIILIPPDAANDPVPCLFKVQSTGRSTVDNAERDILAYLTTNPIEMAEIKLPAALISMATAGLGGNARIHWGEAWSKNNFTMLSKSQMDYIMIGDSDYDQWAKYRSESQILFGATWKIGVGKDIFNEADPTNTTPGAPPASGDYEDALEHYLPSGILDWPDMASRYQEFKDQAIAHGRYYSTDAAGNIYKDGIEDAAHLVDFVTEFEHVDRDASPYDLLFIDTVNSMPPAADGSNLATVVSAGDSTGLKGVFYMCANFVQTGVGSPPTLGSAEKPDLTTESLNKIYLDGVLYSAGTLELGGNAGIYGCAVAEKGFVGGGTPDIYYNHRLRDGLELPKGNIGSVFTIKLQDNF